MKTVNSISGGQTSAFLAANFKADYNLFALVTTSDKKCLFPDKKLRQIVSDKIGREFIGTLEENAIVHTMLDLEQFLGSKVTWVAGITYDEVVEKKGGWLPNKLHRYCTTHLKLEPMFYWWAEHIGEPVEMRLGSRANEIKRKIRTLEKVNSNGLLEFEATFGKHYSGRHKGKNKWETLEWQKPAFPLIDQRPTYKDEIVEFWKDKPVRFAEMNNCVGCFHRNPLLLRKMFDKHPNKMQWFVDQEQIKQQKDKRATWRSDVSYSNIKKHNPQNEINFNDFDNEFEGGCGL